MEESPDWILDPEHSRHAREILEFAYYRRGLRIVPDELAHALQERDALRRHRGAELLRVCPGDWRKNGLRIVVLGAKPKKRPWSTCSPF